MSDSRINAALSARLASFMSSAPGFPKQYENTAFMPTSGSAYVSESLIPSSAGLEGISAGSFSEHVGIYQVSVFAPKDATKGPRAIADAICAHFPKALQLVKDGITVSIVRSVQAPAFVSGDRWIVPVSIYYRAMV